MSTANYDTVRGLEKKSRPLFRAAGIMGIAGVVLLLVGSGTLVSVLGIVALLAGVGVFFFGMIWMIRAQKEPTRQVYCPYCASKNDVFVSRREFACDICSRLIGFSPAGEPVPTEPSPET